MQRLGDGIDAALASATAAATASASVLTTSQPLLADNVIMLCRNRYRHKSRHSAQLRVQMEMDSKDSNKLAITSAVAAVEIGSAAVATAVRAN